KAPIIFEPLAMERVWGGRRLESRLHKVLPPGTPVGESWEIVDRAEAQSVVHQGPLQGKTLHELWTDYREEIFGAGVNGGERFPLLLKILDAREKLSVQVHPPAAIAKSLGGEPKTEMWYFLHCEPGAQIYAGLKKGVTRDAFEELVRTGKVEQGIHAIDVHEGESIFIPSGRLHAIGGGNLIIEAQQNSDTTYRVFDWNRVGLDDKPRKLHVEESLLSLDFEDHEPGLSQPQGETLADCPYFDVQKWTLSKPRTAHAQATFSIFTPVEGEVECGGLRFRVGDFFLVPALLHASEIKPLGENAKVLRITVPQPGA
ncbi:MAG: type I phosphomannose isomerase catalytic subunit, partial [Chthoniobacterales bacterium]